MPARSSTSSTAVWYLIAATFIFTSPLLFFRDAGLWLSILTLVVGGMVFGVGMVVLQRERRHPENPSEDQPPADGSADQPAPSIAR